MSGVDRAAATDAASARMAARPMRSHPRPGGRKSSIPCTASRRPATITGTDHGPTGPAELRPRASGWSACSRCSCHAYAWPLVSRCHSGFVRARTNGRRSVRSIPSDCAVGERRFNHTPRGSKRSSGSPSVPGTSTIAAGGTRSHNVWSPSTTFACTPATEPAMRAVKFVATGSVRPTCAEATPGSAAAATANRPSESMAKRNGWSRARGCACAERTGAAASQAAPRLIAGARAAVAQTGTLPCGQRRPGARAGTRLRGRAATASAARWPAARAAPGSPRSSPRGATAPPCST